MNLSVVETSPKASLAAEATTVYMGDQIQGMSVIGHLNVNDLKPSKQQRFSSRKCRWIPDNSQTNSEGGS